MKVLLSHEMRQVDKNAIEDYGIPGVVLMENAAIQVLHKVLEHTKALDQVMIFCGTGNNGGDGFAIARHLANKGVDVQVLLLGDDKQIKGDALIQFTILKNMGITIEQINEDTVNLGKLKVDILSKAVIVDAIFGTGLYRPVEGFRKDIIKVINDSPSYVIAVDVPSGINADNGQILGVAVLADCTVTFALPKVGLLLYPGAYYVGELKVADISIPYGMELLKHIKGNVLTDEEAEIIKPLRQPWSNKGTYGKVTIIAGSKNMTGAALLCGKAAYSVGAGLVRLVIPAIIQPVIQSGLIEAVTLPYSTEKCNTDGVETDEMGIISDRDVDAIKKAIRNSSVIAIGSGLSTDKYVASLIKLVLENAKVPIIIDADGLNILSENLHWLKQRDQQIIITPHVGEMSRLINRDVSYIKENIIETAVTFSKEYEVVCVLKDARTIVAYPDGSYSINITGNDGMATAGSGDVLAGIIASLVGQGLKIEEAATLGVYLHGKAGDRALSSTNQKVISKSSLIASNLCDFLGGIM